MTLRTRLVLALVLLSAVCLATFAWATTTLYERSQRDQLDDQLVASAGPLVSTHTGRPASRRPASSAA